MRYLSVCSGIEAATVAWHHMGWQPVAFSDIEPFPSAVLAHHYPHVPNLGDMTKFEEWNLESVDLLVGGTPCQSFSVAGLRKGLADPRGNLMLTFLAIAQRQRPRWIVWENVPGVLSSNGGRDFGTFLGALGELGYGFAYRVLDAQWFGVAQRRRRVFVVGCLGDWQRPAQVLFERESVRRDTAPSRATRQEVAARSEAGSGSTGQPYAVANCLTQRMYKGINTTLDEGQTPVLTHYRKSRRAQSTTDHETWVEDDATNTLNCFDVGDVRATDVVAQPITQFGNIAGSLTARHDSSPCADRGQNVVAQPIAIHPHVVGRSPNAGPQGKEYIDDGSAYCMDARGVPQSVAQPVAPALTASNDPSRSPQSSEVTQQVEAVYGASMQVRRLTPVECERLQGFPDNYTNIPWRKKPESPDGPRYKALGNSMAVPVMRWIGERINEVDK